MVLSSLRAVCLLLHILCLLYLIGTQCFHVGAGGEREKEQCQVKEKEH